LLREVHCHSAPLAAPRRLSRSPTLLRSTLKMADTSDFRTGLAFEWRDGVWQITDMQHVKPGKGGAFVRTTLRNVRDGRVQQENFRAGAQVEDVRVEKRPHQYLYEDDYGLHFMNTETYEQFSMPPERVDGREFISEGSELDILFRADTDEPLSTSLPDNVDRAVADTRPGVKGDTAQGGTKPATLESGATVDVPLFIEEGDVVRVATGSGEYVTRVST
jgi:elongation factor P